jgi:DNA-binding IclR family transcriptional regulator
VEQRSVLARATKILAAFDEHHATLKLGALTERSGLPRSTVHRTAEQLVELRWLERGSDGYRPGLLLFELGGLVPRVSRIRQRALPFMEEVHQATRELVQLAVLDGPEVVYLEKLGGHDSSEVSSRPGGRLPASCTGLGKAMLAHAGEDAIELVIAAGLTRRTVASITDADVFRAALADVRATGIAVDREEAEPGIACIAVPIRGSGRAVAAVSVTGPVERIHAERVEGPLRRAALGVWRSLFPSRADSD